jgi:hypothetical protein
MSDGHVGRDPGINTFMYYDQLAAVLQQAVTPVKH